ncbi:MAG: LamG domain-containing protein, partial [Bacteroidota bacterium]
GADFTDDRPNVLNAGVTDESGYYLIDGINYGGGQNFTARPAKSFQFNNALEFNATNQQYAQLSGFTPRDTGTIEIWFKPAALTGTQSILAYSNNFDLRLNGTSLELLWNGGSAVSLANIPNTDYVHVAMAYTSTGSPNLTTYINGEQKKTFDVSPINDWGSGDWQVGRSSGETNYFTGLVDEIVFYNNMRTQAQIEADQLSIDITDLDLATYFSFNESVGIEVNDQSPNNQGSGTIVGASWTAVSAIPEEVPHEFNPGSRIVTLDPSNVGVDNVDFEDLSTVGVSGFVVFDGTQCPAEGVEILVNGISNIPPIFTDSDGKFTADFEPGSSFRLSPKYKEHNFLPAFWDINNIVVPKAGVVFKDQEKRNVEGILAGGFCEKSIVGTGDSVVIQLKATNDCFVQDFVFPEGTTKFEFKRIPPIDYTVALIHHSQNNIKQQIENRVGAPQIDLEPGDTSLSFIYQSDIFVETTDLPVDSCGRTLLTQNGKYQIDIRVYEEYNNIKCYLDSVVLTIANDISGG